MYLLLWAIDKVGYTGLRVHLGAIEGNAEVDEGGWLVTVVFHKQIPVAVLAKFS